jgi:hypothetical protein
MELNTNSTTDSSDILYVKCPHCNDDIIIFRNEINCAIFRHAIFKNTYEQINPHSSKELCETYIADDSVYGCAKPFKLVNNCPEICDYI